MVGNLKEQEGEGKRKKKQPKLKKTITQFYTRKRIFFKTK